MGGPGAWGPLGEPDFFEKSHFKGIFELKTVYFAYKPISDGLF